MKHLYCDQFLILFDCLLELLMKGYFSLKFWYSRPYPS